MVLVKENCDYEVLTTDGFKSFEGLSINTRTEMIYIETSKGYNLTCTVEHLIECENIFIPAIDLTIGQTILTDDGLDEIVCKEIVDDENEVFDLLNVEDTNSFICNGISVHNCLIVDERAFIPNRQWDAFISSVYPTISSSDESRVIYVSTFNGLNHFYQDWEKANSTDPKVKSEFKPIRVDWWQVPGRDEEWKEETISNIGITRFRQEFGNEALGSIKTLVEPEVISALKAGPDNPDSPILKKFEKSLHEYLKIYDEPKKKRNYVIGVDSAKMTEENAGDALGMQVLDITEFPIRQVATFFAKEGISYLQCPNIIAKLGTYYNEAYVFIENNEIGQEVANMVNFDCEYENTYFEKGSLAGYRTTKKTKRIGCDNLRLLLENGKLILSDFSTISQLSTFAKKKDSYCAESGYQDDLVMALISALFFLQAKGLDFDLVENTSDLGTKILSALEKPEEEDAPLTIYIEEVEIVHNDFDWL